MKIFTSFLIIINLLLYVIKMTNCNKCIFFSMASHFMNKCIIMHFNFFLALLIYIVDNNHRLPQCQVSSEDKGLEIKKLLLPSNLDETHFNNCCQCKWRPGCKTGCHAPSILVMLVLQTCLFIYF